MPPVLERIGVDDALDHLGADLRRTRAPDHVVNRADAGQQILDGQEREVGAEKDFVGDQIFLRAIMTFQNCQGR